MFDAVARNISFLLGGYWITVKLTLFALAGGISLGILVGLGRISKKRWVYYPVTFYVNLIRNIPLILPDPNVDSFERQRIPDRPKSLLVRSPLRGKVLAPQEFDP